MQVMPAQSPELSAAIGAGLKDSRALNEENWIQFGLWCQNAFQSIAVVQELHRRGTISDRVYQTEVQSAAGLLRNWPDVRRTVLL